MWCGVTDTENGRDYNPKPLFVGQLCGEILLNYRHPWQLGQPYDTLAIEIVYHRAMSRPPLNLVEPFICCLLQPILLLPLYI